MKKPSQRTWIIGGLAAAALIATGAFALSVVPVPAGTTSAGGGSTAVPAHAGAAGGEPQAGSSPPPASPGGAPPSAGERYTTEVIPAAPTTNPALPPTVGLPYPISAPLPATASAQGRLVAGYPSSVVPGAPGSSIESSSVASQASKLQVTLTARTAGEVSDIVAFYRAALAKFGMYDKAAPAQGGSTSVIFSRDGNAVTLTATPGPKGTSYVLYGAFTAAG